MQYGNVDVGKKYNALLPRLVLPFVLKEIWSWQIYSSKRASSKLLTRPAQIRISKMERVILKQKVEENSRAYMTYSRRGSKYKQEKSVYDSLVGQKYAELAVSTHAVIS